MINYTEKGNGLHKAIVDAGHWLKQVDNVWQSSDDTVVQAIIDNYTLQSSIDEIKARIDEHAKGLRNKAVEGVSPGEMASWGIKRAEALAYQASSNVVDAPGLNAEATARGVALQNVVDRVSGNATTLLNLETTIAGVAGKHKDAVAAKQTFAEVVYYDFSADWPEV